MSNFTENQMYFFNNNPNTAKLFIPDFNLTPKSLN